MDLELKKERSIESQLPINNIKRKPANQMHDTVKEYSKNSKRPSAGYSRRFNPLKVVNTESKFIDNVISYITLGNVSNEYSRSKDPSTTNV